MKTSTVNWAQMPIADKRLVCVCAALSQRGWICPARVSVFPAHSSSAVLPDPGPVCVFISFISVHIVYKESSPWPFLPEVRFSWSPSPATSGLASSELLFLVAHMGLVMSSKLAGSPSELASVWSMV